MRSCFGIRPRKRTLAARHSSAPVINAGDGCGQHPTQALLYSYALGRGARRLRRTLTSDASPSWGDVLHSRVARSVIPGFSAGRDGGCLWSPPGRSCRQTMVLLTCPCSPLWTRRSSRGRTFSRRRDPAGEDDRRADRLRGRVRQVLRRVAAPAGEWCAPHAPWTGQQGPRDRATSSSTPPRRQPTRWPPASVSVRLSSPSRQAPSRA